MPELKNKKIIFSLTPLVKEITFSADVKMRM